MLFYKSLFLCKFDLTANIIIVIIRGRFCLVAQEKGEIQRIWAMIEQCNIGKWEFTLDTATGHIQIQVKGEVLILRPNDPMFYEFKNFAIKSGLFQKAKKKEIVHGA